MTDPLRLPHQIVRTVFFLLTTLVLASLQLLMRPLLPSDPYCVARLWHRTIARIIGLRIRVSGQPVPAPARVLFLSNHVSHADINVLGGFTPARFVSKREVKAWPLFGFLAQLQDTLFINRAANSAALAETRGILQDALTRGDRLILFPEGTNTIGNKVLPFKRGALDGLSAAGYVVQPVAIRCLSVAGRTLDTEADYEVYGWGDVSFAGHLWTLMGYRYVDIEVVFTPPIPVADTITTEIIAQAEEAVRAHIKTSP